MRVNRFVAAATGCSRRAADEAIRQGRVTINGQVATLGSQIADGDRVEMDGSVIVIRPSQTIMLHKPVGYITSRRQQGSTPTIYSLLPPELHHLKPVGRLDRDTSGLLLLTNDGALAQQLQHPSSGKTKHYQVWLDHPLTPVMVKQVKNGIELEDGASHMTITPQGSHYQVGLQEGRNRQIRRSFAALGRRVIKLHRDRFGDFELGKLQVGSWRTIEVGQ